MTKIDSYNEKILHTLQQDGRLSNTNLAKTVGLSPSACLRRVQDLERSGVIQGYRAVINPKSIGRDVVIFVMVGLSGHLRKDSQAFEAAMLPYCFGRVQRQIEYQSLKIKRGQSWGGEFNLLHLDVGAGHRQ